MEEARAARDAALTRSRDAASDTCAEIWERAQGADAGHPYLRRKGVAPHGARVTGDGRLVVPLYIEGRLSSLQYIDHSGGKLDHAGGQVGGASWVVGRIEPDGPVFFAEGFATSATIHQATNRPCVVCYSASNLPTVVGQYRESLGRGQELVVVADNDESGTGQKYADQAAALHSCRVVMPPEVGQDANDFVQAGGDLKSILEVGAGRRAEPPRQANSGHFTALGYSGSSYYYLPRATEQVAQIRRDSHTNSSSLMALAPLEWWEHLYPKERGGADWQLAASHLMRQCEARGLYDHELERGRGAWYDRGRSVLHLVDKLLVDGQEMAISDLDSSYIYTRLPHMDSSVSAAPASDEQSSAVVALIDHLNWTKPEHSRFLAGWIALAPICGALRWRPHVWLTAQRGAGKSWVQDRIIYPLLGRSAIHVQGATTEAGIRQRLKQDGRPVIFDEAEPGAGRGKDRIQGVIILARQASSDSGAEIIKGTTDGAGMAFRARSMFLMGSINVGLHEAADESRFTVLSLEEPSGSAQAQQRFREYASEVDRMMTKELCASVRARMYKMIPTIRENANLLAAAVAEQLSSQRMGDQVGTLLAGWNAMLSTELLCMEEARGIVASMDWDDAEQQKTVSDEENLLAAIMQAQVRFDADGRSHTRSIGELIECAAGRVAGCGDTSPLEANAALGRHGLRVDGPTLYVANAHKELQRALDHTPWAAGWHTILRRLPGAGPCKTGVRMGGVLSRVTSIPLESVL